MRILQFTIGRNKMILSEMPDKFIWRKMFPHLTKLANSFGLRQKDINFSYMEYISWNRTENETPMIKNLH